MASNSAEASALAGPLAANPQAGTWLGHPPQLARLFVVEAGERFGFFGMRALLVLYLTKHFLFDDRQAAALYGGFASLIYLTPLVGGWLADRYLGVKRSVTFGALLMAAGYLVLCFGGQAARPYAVVEGTRYEVQIDGRSRQQYLIEGERRLAIKGQPDGTVLLVAPDGRPARRVASDRFVPAGERSPFYTMVMLLALSTVVVGNGFFKPNIATAVGALYATGDRRRDAGFTIFYVGINLGSLLSQALCPWFADWFGWWAGFLLAACSMLLSWSLIQFDGGRLAGAADQPRPRSDRRAIIYGLAIVAIPVVWLLLHNQMDQPLKVGSQGIGDYISGLPVLAKVLFCTFLLSVIGIPLWSWRAGTRQEAQMMLAATVLVIFNVVFWALSEQAGSSLTFFASRNVDLSVFGWFSLRPAQAHIFVAIFVIALGPVFSVVWLALARRGREPSIPLKFGIALTLMGLSFLLLVAAGRIAADAAYRISLWWLVLVYLMHAVSELCISPVGLSMITKLAMARVVGMMMGVWFLSIAMAQYCASIAAQVASVPTVAGEVTNAAVSLDIYLRVFRMIGIVGVIAGLVLAGPGSWLLKRWMNGVR